MIDLVSNHGSEFPCVALYGYVGERTQSCDLMRTFVLGPVAVL